MKFGRKFVKWMDSNAPSMIGDARYHYHVGLRGDIVYPKVSPILFERIGSKSATAIDVGANVGIYTRYLCRYFSSVVSVEPIPYLAERLEASGIGNCRVEQVALGDQSEIITMRVPVNAAGDEMPALSTASKDNSLSFIASAGIIERKVQCRRLDEIAQICEKLAFVKIDVEGFEGAVLSGAAKVLTELRPIFQVEIGRAHNPNYLEITSLFAQNEFTGFAVQKDGLYTDVEYFLNSQPLVVSDDELDSPSGCWDYLFIPNERVKIVSADLVRK